MKKLITQLKNEPSKKILIIGDVMVDQYCFGSVSRISPEAPVPVITQEKIEWCLGGAANVAANSQKIGCDVTLIGVISRNDDAGKKYRKLLEEIKIKEDGTVYSQERRTTCKKRILAGSHQMLRIDDESSTLLTPEEFDDIRIKIDQFLVPGVTVLLSDYAKGVITKELVQYVCKRAKSCGSIVMLDPKGKDFSKYYGVDYIKPNLNEYNHLLDFYGLSSDNSIKENGHIICKKLGLKGLIVTRGEKGIVFVSSDDYFTYSAYRREVYDLTGAGDTVFAFLALGFAHNITIKEILVLANYAASIVVSHLKTYSVSLDDLLDCGVEHAKKIYNDWTQLKIELDWQRCDGKRVVFTNGCFDILHPGHLHTLKEAKRRGEVLVVALNTDASVKRLKGQSRPINDLQHRQTMMAALGVVDFVVSFDQDTPQEIINYLAPDILVKGGDYKKESVVGYDTITARGGAVHIIDFVEGLSTTNMISSIKSHYNKMKE